MECERRSLARYRPRRPSQSVLYRCVQEHLETWLVQCRDGHDDDRSMATVRQWVLAVPKRMRYFLLRDADLQGVALRLYLRTPMPALRSRPPSASACCRASSGATSCPATTHGR